MFDPGIAVGTVLTEREVHDTFECQTTFGIRMSRKNNLFVIMSGSAKEQVYHDWWEGDTLYYNGTDCNSDENANQTLTKGRGNNNSQLYQVWLTEPALKKQIFLFVKRVKNQCVYKGEVDLVKEPYLQPRHDDPSRSVWIFPLRLRSVDIQEDRERFLRQERAVFEYDSDELRKLAKSRESVQPDMATRVHRGLSSVYDRDSYISAYAKIRARGRCDLCGQPSPFSDRSGYPYLEEHHVLWLSRGGRDSIDNVVALCPNCHRKMHVVDDAADVEFLKRVLIEYEG